MNTESEPLVSIIMACYNDGKYIEESVQSIINQTYNNWELIVVNDASTDDSAELVSEIKDERILLINNEYNKGLAASLNIGIRATHSPKYIARLDSDDIAYPDRLEKQVRYLEANREVCIVGANIDMFHDGEAPYYLTKQPTQSDRLMAFMPFCSPLAHSTWMVSMEAFSEGFFYDDRFRSSQDYELMYRLLDNNMQIACIQEPLVKYRVRDNSISHKRRKVDPNTFATQKRVAEKLGIINKDDYIRAIGLTNADENHDFKTYLKAVSYCIMLVHANAKRHLFSQKQLIIIVIKQIYAMTRFMLQNRG